MDSNGYLTEIPSYLKQLARLIARGFFQIEDSLLIDLLIRHPCMKEKELEDLLKFDAKLLRARLTTLKNEKFVQTRLRMETGADGKAQKVNYYFVNYKSLVNVIKYKLDHMRKKMETQERDATSRASFKCTNCDKTFTDYEAGELFDPLTQNFYCTFCRSPVEEDETAVPTDSRLLLARFNEQMEVVFDLLRKAENIKLAPELLEPEPPKQLDGPTDSSGRDRTGIWSGEATRSTGNDETRIDVTIGDDGSNKPREQKKERPIWMMESTIGKDYGETASGSGANTGTKVEETGPGEKSGPREDIMSVLLAYEKKGSSSQKSMIPEATGDSDSDEDPDNINIPDHLKSAGGEANSSSAMEVDDDDVGVMEEDDDDDAVPMVSVGKEKIPITDVTSNPEIIERMTPAEKEEYVRQYQEYYAQE